MKKHILFLVVISLVLILFANQQVYCQFERLKVEYTVEEVFVDNTTVYNLTISIENPTGDVIFSIFKDAPIPENLIEESKPIPENTYTFKNLPAGSYSIKVYENEKKGGFESIDLGN